MKKFLFTIVFFSIVSSVYALSPSCTDLSKSLGKGAESASVLSLQNFLYAKGFLKVTPNGYFGPSTAAAMKLYQKSQGLAQTGSAGPATRSAIKKESCTVSSSVASRPEMQPLPSNSASSPSLPAQAPASAQATPLPRPKVDSYDLVTLFAGGTTDWGFSLYGSGFSTTSNTVIFRNTETRVPYTIGTFVSATGTSLLLPKNLTGTAFSCGTGCLEKLPSGQYQIIVQTQGGESDPKPFFIKPFTVTIQNLASETLPAASTGKKVALVSFSAPAAITVRDFSFTLGSSTISGSGLSVSQYGDELSGGEYKKDAVLSAFQTGSIGVYASTNNTQGGTINGIFSITIEDFIGKKRSTFTTSPILMTVAGVI